VARQSKLTEKESNDYKELLQYIQSIYLQQGYSKQSIPFAMLTSQIKNMMTDHKEYKYSAIKYVLEYMVNTLELNLFNEESNGSILSLVPYYYNEAREFCIKCAEIKKLANEFDFTPNVRVVKVGNRDKKIKEMEW
jgi:hypothetical protein